MPPPKAIPVKPRRSIRGSHRLIEASTRQAGTEALSNLLPIHRPEYPQFPGVENRFRIGPYCCKGETEHNLRNKIDCGD